MYLLCRCPAYQILLSGSTSGTIPVQYCSQKAKIGDLPPEYWILPANKIGNLLLPRPRLSLHTQKCCLSLLIRSWLRPWSNQYDTGLYRSIAVVLKVAYHEDMISFICGYQVRTISSCVLKIRFLFEPVIGCRELASEESQFKRQTMGVPVEVTQEIPSLHSRIPVCGGDYSRGFSCKELHLSDVQNFTCLLK